VSLPDITTREKWLAARTELLAKEKEHTRRYDALNAERRRLPMVEITKSYTFTGPDGEVTLAGLFAGRSQLIIQHVMYAPDWDTGCRGCTATLDEIAPGTLRHLEARDTSFAAVSRAPYPKLAAYRREHGWSFAWYSSDGSDFNYDFDATVDQSVKPGGTYNYQQAGARQQSQGEEAIEGEMPGNSCFLRDGDRIFHTYSCWARGTDTLGSAYSLLDLTAFGRSEDWEEPKGRVARPHAALPTFTD
jgi:predicted dithiol-disulfide oxidoreductase (DUF899 family)